MDDAPRLQLLLLTPQLPLPAFFSMPFGRMTLSDGTMLTLRLGLDQTLVGKLKERSLDESDAELQTNTSDKRRFGEGSYEEWYAKGRIPFALTDEAGELAALIWFGPEPYPLASNMPADAWDTIAFRSYLPYRGKKIMTPFGQAVLKMHERIAPGRKLWLATDKENEGATRLYAKLGFIEQGYAEEGTRRIMTLEPEAA